MGALRWMSRHYTLARDSRELQLTLLLFTVLTNYTLARDRKHCHSIFVISLASLY